MKYHYPDPPNASQRKIPPKTAPKSNTKKAPAHVKVVGAFVLAQNAEICGIKKFSACAS